MKIFVDTIPRNPNDCLFSIWHPYGFYADADEEFFTCRLNGNGRCSLLDCGQCSTLVEATNYDDISCIVKQYD